MISFERRRIVAPCLAVAAVDEVAEHDQEKNGPDDHPRTLRSAGRVISVQKHVFSAFRTVLIRDAVAVAVIARFKIMFARFAILAHGRSPFPSAPERTSLNVGILWFQMDALSISLGSQFLFKTSRHRRDVFALQIELEL
jgi:hypothetical protein